MKIKQKLNSLATYCRANKESIYTGLGIAGLVGTGLSAYKAGDKAHDISKYYKEELDRCETKEERKPILVDYGRAMAPILAAPVILGTASSYCILQSNKVSSKKLSAMTAAYAMTSNDFEVFKAKAAKQISKKGFDTIANEANNEKIALNPPVENNTINGFEANDLCYDPWSGRYYRTNYNLLEAAINKVSHDVLDDMSADLNTLYGYIGVPYIESGNDFGWDTDDLYDGRVPISIGTSTTPDNRPCLTLNMCPKPLSYKFA